MKVQDQRPAALIIEKGGRHCCKAAGRRRGPLGGLINKWSFQAVDTSNDSVIKPGLRPANLFGQKKEGLKRGYFAKGVELPYKEKRALRGRTERQGKGARFRAIARTCARPFPKSNFSPLLPFYFPLPIQILARRTRNSIHAKRSGRGLIRQNLCIREYVAIVHLFLEVVHNSQGIIGVIVLIPDKPADFLKGPNEIRTCGVFHFPRIIKAIQLKAPELAALNNRKGNITHQLVHMLETLRRAIERDMVMAATEQAVEKVSVEIFFKRAAVHLQGKLIHANGGNGKSVVRIIIDGIAL